MPRPEGRDPAKERYWRRLLQQWRRTGMTGRDFCLENRLSQPSFYAWKREIARRDQEAPARTKAATGAASARRSAALPAFLPVAMDTATAAALEVVLPQGRVLRVRRGFDAELLRQLVRLLEEPSC